MGHMGRPCSICGRYDREDIDRALESGESLRLIAVRFGISSSALHRHKNDPRREPAIGSVTRADQAAQAIAVPQNVPVSALPAPVKQPEPEWPSRLKTLSGQPKTETPAFPAVLEERPALPKNNDGRPGLCPVCGSNRWRQLDGYVTCDVCRPLPPSPGTFMHTGRTVSEPRGAATPIRVPIALS
jgi:hypothetical protein